MNHVNEPRLACVIARRAALAVTDTGARGQMKLHARDAKGIEYDFVYELQ
jgi:hypothetical protein